MFLAILTFLFTPGAYYPNPYCSFTVSFAGEDGETVTRYMVGKNGVGLSYLHKIPDPSGEGEPTGKWVVEDENFSIKGMNCNAARAHVRNYFQKKYQAQ